MSREDLKLLISMHATQILMRTRTPPDEAVTVEVDRGDVSVRIQVVQSNLVTGDQPTRFPGSWLSSTEQLIWNSLGDRPLIGKQVAAKLGWDYSTKLRYLLSNLEERGVLLHDEVEGYSRAPSPPA